MFYTAQARPGTMMGQGFLVGHRIDSWGRISPGGTRRDLVGEPFGSRLWNIIERAGALVLLVALAPVLVALGVAVLLVSGRFPLVSHRRVGWRGEPFWMLKLRTMWGPGEKAVERGPWGLRMRIDEDAAGLPKPPDDPRVSGGFAQLCRRFSLDELPQLVHVVSGRMALVGPRPLTRSELDEHYGSDATEVLSVRPGLTGLWQTMGRSRLTYHQRRRLDLFLVRHAGFRFHARILVRSVFPVLTGRDSC